jgi:type I restriction enzyme S subunit
LLAVLDPPDQWRVRWFGRLVDRVQEVGRSDLQPLSVFLDQGVVPRLIRADNYNRSGADLSKYPVVKPGDIVFNKLRTWQGGLGVSKYEGIVSPAYYVCRPRQGVEPRFLHYLLHSVTYFQRLRRQRHTALRGAEELSCQYASAFKAFARQHFSLSERNKKLRCRSADKLP